MIKIDEKLKQLNELIFEYQKHRLLFKNHVEYLKTGLCLETTHQEIFFSANLFNKFNLLKLLSSSKFEKVIAFLKLYIFFHHVLF